MRGKPNAGDGKHSACGADCTWTRFGAALDILTVVAGSVTPARVASAPRTLFAPVAQPASAVQVPLQPICSGGLAGAADKFFDALPRTVADVASCAKEAVVDKPEVAEIRPAAAALPMPNPLLASRGTAASAVCCSKASASESKGPKRPSRCAGLNNGSDEPAATEGWSSSSERRSWPSVPMPPSSPQALKTLCCASSTPGAVV